MVSSSFGVILGFLGLSGGIVNPLIGGTLLLLGMMGMRTPSMAVAAADVPAFSVEEFAEQMADPNMQDSALGNLSWRVSTAKLDEATQEKVTEILAAALVGPRDWESYATPAAILVQIEGDAARARIDCDAVLAADNARLAEALQVLGENHLKIDSKRHDRVLKDLLALDEVSEVQQRALDAAVAALAQRGESSRARLEELLQGDRSRLGALRGLNVLAGVTEPWMAVWQAGKKSEAQRAFAALNAYAQALSWGDHKSFFANEDADDFPAAIRALKAEGRNDLFLAAREAALLLDASGWQKKQPARLLLIENLDEAAQGRLAELDEIVRAAKRGLDECALEVVLRHPGDFGGKDK